MSTPKMKRNEETSSVGNGYLVTTVFHGILSTCTCNLLAKNPFPSRPGKHVQPNSNVIYRPKKDQLSKIGMLKIGWRV